MQTKKAKNSELEYDNMLAQKEKAMQEILDCGEDVSLLRAEASSSSAVVPASKSARSKAKARAAKGRSTLQPAPEIQDADGQTSSPWSSNCSRPSRVAGMCSQPLHGRERSY